MGTTVEGIFLPFGKSNNGHIYNSDSIDLFDYQKFINEGTALGELCSDLNLKWINLDNVSHRICRVDKTSEGIQGVIEILDTPKGKIAQSLLEIGITFRPRMIGTIVNGITHVDEIISFDIVPIGADDTFNPDNYRNRRYKLSKK